MEKLNLKEEWNCFLCKSIYKYFVTITFKYDISYYDSVKCLNKLLYFVNSEYYGRNYTNNKKHLKGIVTYETHQKGNYHFHIIIADDDIDSDKSLPRIIREKSNKIKLQRRIPKMGYAKEYRVLGFNSIKIDEIYSKNINGYVTKKCKIFNYQNISPLTYEGVIFGNI